MVIIPAGQRKYVTGADLQPVRMRKIHVGQRLLNAVFYLLGGFFELQSRKPIAEQTEIDRQVSELAEEKKRSSI